MNIDRREAILAGGVLAIATLNSTAAPAETLAPAAQPLTNVSDAAASTSKTLAANLPALNKANRWIAKKRELETKFDWLKQAFGDDQSVDSIVYDITNGLLTTEPPYDPYQVEALASSISVLLDRCLSYRNDMYALEERAVKRLLDYELFSDTFDAQRNIELAPRTAEQLQANLSNQQKAVSSFAQAASGPEAGLGTGFSAVYAGSVAATKIGLEWEGKRQGYVAVKWDKTKESQDSLAARYTVPGHALNYGERYKRLKALLTQDISVAYQKIRCLYLACNKLFDLKLVMQEPFLFGYLEYLVLFARDIANSVETATVEEIEFDHVVYLRQPRTKSDATNAGLIDQATWENIVSAPQPGTPGPKGTGLLGPINLDKEFSAGIKRLRVRAIGLSLDITVPTDGGINAAKLKSTSAVVFPPAQDNLFSAGSQKDRPPVIVQGVSSIDLGSARMVQTPAINNIDPRSAPWFIQVSSNLYVPDLTAHPRNKDDIRDIKLHLRLSALVEKAPAKWLDYSS